MNRQIVRMFGFFVVLFAVLLGFTSYWSVFDAKDLRNSQLNRRQLLQEQSIPRGLIYGADGTVLARNKKIRTKGSETFYSRVYPTGNLFAHAVGYDFIAYGRVGLEQYYNPELTGQDSELTTVLDQLRGKKKEGEDLHTSLVPSVQKAAISALQATGKRGSVIALDPRTGAVQVMANVPSYNPNLVPQDFSELQKDPASPLLNRATQSGYPPGSTMKPVTVSAALDSGKFTPDSVVDGNSPQTFASQPLANFGNKSYGEITVTEALTNSVNTAIANVAVGFGQETLYKYMQRFGFYGLPPIDLPKDQLFTSGVYKNNKLQPVGTNIDIARTAIGQAGLLAAPIQMAMAVQAIANDGKLLEPFLVRKIVDHSGLSTSEHKPTEVGTAIDPKSAEELTQMMIGVVDHGTGVAAQISGIKVAGKTGTAETGFGSAVNQAWFIGFAPADKPRVAVAVTIEGTPDQGGIVAAPIAKTVMEGLLSSN